MLKDVCINCFNLHILTAHANSFSNCASSFIKHALRLVGKYSTFGQKDNFFGLKGWWPPTFLSYRNWETGGVGESGGWAVRLQGLYSWIMIDGSKKHHCWWWFDFHIPHVIERHRNVGNEISRVCLLRFVISYEMRRLGRLWRSCDLLAFTAIFELPWMCIFIICVCSSVKCALSFSTQTVTFVTWINYVLDGTVKTWHFTATKAMVCLDKLACFHAWANIVWFQKVSILPHGRSLEIPRGRGVLKANFLEGTYEAKTGISWGVRGCKQKTFNGGNMDIFWNYTLKKVSHSQ